MRWLCFRKLWGAEAPLQMHALPSEDKSRRHFLGVLLRYSYACLEEE